MASSAQSTDPPYYVLIAQGQSLSPAAVPASTSLSHPVIEYHYADDSPHSLLPQYPGEHILVLDYDPARPGTPSVNSLSPDLVVSAVKVTDAPGAAVAGEPALRNNSMFVIETTIKSVDSPPVDDDDPSVHAVLARFKQRNAVLRRILDFPNQPGSTQDPPPDPVPSSSPTPPT